jgi:hypothetical protein
MPILLALLLSAILGGLGRRVAGGAIGQWFDVDVGDLPPRIFFAVTVAAGAALGWAAGGVVHEWWHLLALVPLVWVGTTLGNGEAMDMGRDQGGFWRDFVAMTLVGLAGTILPTAAAWWEGYAWVWMLLGGITAAPAYSLGWILMGHRNMALPLGIQGGSEAGEVMFGAGKAMGACLCVYMTMM